MQIKAYESEATNMQVSVAHVYGATCSLECKNYLLH